MARKRRILSLPRGKALLKSKASLLREAFEKGIEDGRIRGLERNGLFQALINKAEKRDYYEKF